MNIIMSWYGTADRLVTRGLGIWRWDVSGFDHFSHALISLACLAASAFLVLHYLRPWQRRLVPYRGIVWMIAGFLLLCGFSHLLDVLAIGTISLSSIMRLATAVTAWATIVGLGCLVCHAQAPRDPREFEKEIIERKGAEKRMAVQHATMQTLASCARLKEAIPELLSTIGQTLDFDVAEFWIVDRHREVLRIAGRPWTSRRIGPEWIRESRDLEFSPGLGLTGRVWSTGCSAWVSDLAKEPAGTLIRSEVAARLGLRSAFGFPIVASEAGPIIGIMMFLSQETMERDEPLLLAMTTLGRQIGLFAERRRAEAELTQVNSRLNALLDASTQVSIIATDPMGMITVFNPGAERMLGYSAEEMVGKTTPLLLHDTEEVKAYAACLSAEFGTVISGFDTFVERARRGGHDVGEWTYIGKDGTRMTVLLAVTAVSDPEGRINGFLGIATDLTDRQRLEDELRKRASELAEADARKNEFLAMLGHELRNPLAPIRNAVKIMKQRGSEDPSLCWARDVIDHQVRQMGQLVDDLLEISRVTRGKVRLQKEVIDVATIISYAVETSRPIIDSHRHRLSIALPSEPVQVEADPVRMAQVLSNLLNNAAKYTEERGQIRLAVSLEDETVVFRVRDNGIGIPAEMLSSVFDLFTQVDRSLDRSQGGLGLGLTLVRRLVEMHGGTVQATSEGLGKGSQFSIRLPVWKPVQPSVQEPASPAGNSAQDGVEASKARSAPRGRKVLVVDDNVTWAESLALLLSLEGHESEVVHDGPTALQSLRKFTYDVVFMDIGLPHMDGYEVARRLRQEPGLGQPMLVAITGYAEDEARRRSHEAGYDHHLVKPVDPEAILALLASMEWAEATDTARPERARAASEV